MPAAGLLVIKKRINSVKGTQKITKAMGLVATSKVKRVRDKLEINNKYFEKIDQMKKDISTLNEKFVDDIFVKPNGSDKKLYVVLASNSGFCGGFNGNGASYLNEKYSTKEEKSKIATYIIGGKGASYVTKYGFDIKEVNTSINGDINIKETRKIVGKLMNMYLKKEVGEIHFVYSKFISPIRQDVAEIQVLPFTNEEEKSKEKSINVFNIDISSEKLIDNFIYRYIEGLLINIMYNSMASEENARMQAMDAATKNARDIIESLNIKYNRIRQAAITQEISEIVSGAESQK